MQRIHCTLLKLSILARHRYIDYDCVKIKRWRLITGLTYPYINTNIYIYKYIQFSTLWFVVGCTPISEVLQGET